MKIHHTNEKEIEQIIHAVIDSKNIVKIDVNDLNLTVIVQNLDNKIIEKCKEQIKEILTPLTSRYYGIGISNIS